MDKLYFINSKVESNSVPFGSILEETREKTVIENEDTLLSCAINGIYRNDELFSHFRGSSNIGYIKIKKNDLVLSAQNLHLGNANVNLRFEHGIISPAYKAYRVIGAVPEYMAQWVKRPQANQFFLMLLQKVRASVEKILIGILCMHRIFNFHQLKYRKK